MRKKRRASYAGFVYEEPTVGWSSEEDVKSKLTKVDLSCSKPIPAAGPPIICDGKTAYIDTSDAHTAVCAISGMGKSIFVFMAEIFLIAKAMENAVIFDPKAELYNRTAGYLAQEGYFIPCLDFRTMDRDGFNILEHPAQLYRSGDRDTAMMMLSDIMNTLSSSQLDNNKIDTFWPITASSYGMGSGGLMFESFPKTEQINLSNWNRFNTEAGFEALQCLLKHIESDDTSIQNLEAILSEPDKTLRSTVSTAHSFLAPFITNNKLKRMLSHSTFRLEDLCKKKTALFIITDDTTTTYNSIVGIILSQIRSHLVSVASKSENGHLPTRFNFVLDETCSIPFPRLEEALATDRSRWIRYHLCIQSLAGLKLRYPKYEALLANCGNLLFLGSTEAEMLERISMQLGKTNITPDGREKPLASVSELMSLKKTWDQKECIYLNLPQSIRFCTSLPSIEAYPLGTRKASQQRKHHPQVNKYTPQDLIHDISNGTISLPFSESEDTPETKPSQTESSKSEIDLKLEREFDKLFGNSNFSN